MIKDAKYFERWERELSASEPSDYLANLKILEHMVDHARKIGAWPPPDPLQGIEVDIEIARVVNALRAD